MELTYSIFFTVTKSFVILISEAVPKKILEVMNVDNISRESVASHLQVLFLLMLRSLLCFEFIHYLVIKFIF